MSIDDITAKVAGQIGLISKLNGYLTDIGSRVCDQPDSYPDAVGLPFVGVDYHTADKDEEAEDGIVDCILSVEIVTRQGIKIRDAKTDVLRALSMDKTLGGFVSSFYPLSVSKASDQGEYRINYALLKFKIKYPADEWDF